MGIIADGDGVVRIDKWLLLGQIGRQLSLRQLLLSGLSPIAINKRFAEDTQVFLGSDAVTTNDIALCQALHHSHIAIVRREDVRHHGSSLCEGHIAKGPVEFVHVDNRQARRLRTNLLKRAQIIGNEVEKVVWQFSSLGIHQIVEEQHLL